MRATDEIALPAILPFDLAATVAALRRRPNARAEAWIEGEYRRVLDLAGETVLFGVRQVTPDAAVVRALAGPLGKPLDATHLEPGATLLARMLGTQVDLAAAQARARRVPELAELVDRLVGMRPPRFPSLWETLLEVIPFQQVSLASGVAMVNRLVEALGPCITYGGAAYLGLPSPTALLGAPDATLRAAGLSAAKVSALRGAAERILSGDLDEREIATLDDEQAVARLMRLPGIGPWSAQLALLRGFRRLGVFPQGDSGATRSMAAVLGLPIEQSRERAVQVLEALGPDRGYLYFLLLGSRLLKQGSIPGATGGTAS